MKVDSYSPHADIARADARRRLRAGGFAPEAVEVSRGFSCFPPRQDYEKRSQTLIAVAYLGPQFPACSPTVSNAYSSRALLWCPPRRRRPQFARLSLSSSPSPYFRSVALLP